MQFTYFNGSTRTSPVIGPMFVTTIIIISIRDRSGKGKIVSVYNLSNNEGQIEAGVDLLNEGKEKERRIQSVIFGR